LRTLAGESIQTPANVSNERFAAVAAKNAVTAPAPIATSRARAVESAAAVAASRRGTT
jgi:hypothetical protein